MKYHHIGIPTQIERRGETRLEAFKMYASGFDDSPYGVEWLRFEPGCPVPEIVRKIPHVAFVVDDLDAAIAGKEILISPNRPSEGVTVAFILDNGAPVEFLKFDGPEFEVWPGGNCRGAAPHPVGRGGESTLEDGTASETVQEVLCAFDKIRRAMLAGDPVAIEACIGDDYEGCGADGRANDRAMMLKAYGPEGVSLEIFDASGIHARVLGRAALVTGMARMKGSYMGGNFEHRARFVDIFERRGSSWLLIASQTTDVK